MTVQQTNGITCEFFESLGYTINKDGSIIGKWGKPLKANVRPNGYYYFTITLGKEYGFKVKNISVHRLLAMKFIPNPLNKPFVNHIDGNKLNNKLENLEWVTRSENDKHAYRIGLRKGSMAGKTGALHHNSRAVIQLKDGKYIAEFGSISEAARETNICYASITDVLAGKYKNGGGYEWQYKNRVS